MERKKYDTDKEKVNEALIKLKEEQLNYQNELKNERIKLDDIIKDIKEKSILKDKLDEDILKAKIKKNTYTNNINTKSKEILILENKIEILNENIINNSKLPSAVRNIINNMRLKGVHNTIGNIITTTNNYEVAISTALGAATSFIVVETEQDVKECIQYLKDNNLGRATFFPLNIIKPKNINPEDLNIIKNEKGVIDIASSLVEYDNLYDNIIKNQLGNVIIVDNIDTLNTLAKKLNYKYRLVTLEGDILYPGGSITGGSNKNNSNLNDKLKLKEMEETLELAKLDLETYNKEYINFENNFNNLEKEETNINKELINLNELLNNRTNKIRTIEDNLNKKELEIKGNEEITSNVLDKKLVSILEETSLVSAKKELTNNELTKLKKEKSELNLLINEVETKYHKTNQGYNKLQNELKESEIILGKYDVKLDNLLLELSDNYNLTYEYAYSNYELDMPIDIARNKVETIKKEISTLGDVNTGAIKEYERVNERYEFLVNQSNDLNEASKELLNIISEMDKIMISRFKETFDKISNEFNNVFKKLFKGGRGLLKLTNPDDILTTGIDIIAEPPGKKLNSIALLSGGEKTLTAIAVLFAILNVKPSPFCILDEVEAALDEANVDTFGKYLQEKKNNTEFILITHKKRTMEYADVLYGITMQESGVSKIVSVNLEKI